PGKAEQHFAFTQLANLMGIAFHHDVAQRHLPVAADGDAVLVPHGQYGRGVHLVHGHLASAFEASTCRREGQGKSRMKMYLSFPALSRIVATLDNIRELPVLIRSEVKRGIPFSFRFRSSTMKVHITRWLLIPAVLAGSLYFSGM